LKLPLEQNFMAIGLAGLLGMIAVMLIDHGLSASTHHYDATKEAGGPPIAPVAAAG
jgi:MFS transporter, AAHS family, benzoate transport protein